MIRIRTPSRLHFGLLSLPCALDGEARRHFGGVGLMIDQPGLELTVAHAKTWSADGPLAQRALSFAQTYCLGVGIQERFALRVESAAPEHAGLGMGTQLGLAVARAIAELTGQAARDAVTLAGLVGRGLRSAIGVHGFDHGGFLVEGGKTAAEVISPLLFRRHFPEDWRILLITPRGLEGTHGRREVEAFSHLADQAPDDRVSDGLCRLVLLGLLPALCEGDMQALGEALFDFNRCAGTLFQAAQGGIYAHPRIEAIIKTLRAAGVKGAGQSSWGPTIFAIAPYAEASSIRDWMARHHGIAQEEMRLASAWNQPASFTDG